MTNTTNVERSGDSNHFDAIIVGASPTSLFEALALEHEGKRVLVVEAKDRLGGAWTTLTLPGIGDVECGTHYLIDLPDVYSFIAQIPGIDLLPVEPLPRYVWPRRVLGRRTGDFRLRWAGKVSPRECSGGLTVKSLRNLVSPYYRYARNLAGLDGRPRRPLRYIRGGTTSLVDALNHLVATCQFEIELNRTIEEVRVSTSEHLAYCKLGQRYVTTSELVVPGSARLQQVYIDNQPTDLPGDIVPSVQLHMIIDNAPEQKISFVQFSGSAYANLASDLTTTCTPALSGSDRRILSAYVRNDVTHDTATANAILEELKAACLLESAAIIERCYWSRFDLPQRSREELRQIEEKGQGVFRTLYAHSFSIAITENAARWLPALKARGASQEAITTASA